MLVDRQLLINEIEKMMNGQITKEDLGWWAFDCLLEGTLLYEPGYEKLLEDALRSLHYFHDTEPIMHSFYPDISEIIYYLKCLKGEEIYRRTMVVHWRV